MPCAGTIAFVDGSVFKGCMCNDRPIKGILIEDGLEYEVTFSNTCDSLISGFKPRPKTKRVVSKMRKEDTSIEGGGSGEGSSEVMGGASAAVEDAMEDGGSGGGEGGMGPGAEDAGGAAEGDGGVGTDRRGGGEEQGEGGAGDAGGGADGGGRGVSNSVGSGGGRQGGGGDGRGREKDGDAEEEMRAEPKEDRVVKIRVGAKDGKGPEREYRLKDLEPLERVVGEYLEHVSQELQQVGRPRFEFGGLEVKETDTPRGLGMADNDVNVIEASFEEGQVVGSGVATKNGLLERVARVSGMFKSVSMPEAALEKLLEGKSSVALIP